MYKIIKLKSLIPCFSSLWARSAIEMGCDSFVTTHFQMVPEANAGSLSCRHPYRHYCCRRSRQSLHFQNSCFQGCSQKSLVIARILLKWQQRSMAIQLTLMTL